MIVKFKRLVDDTAFSISGETERGRPPKFIKDS